MCHGGISGARVPGERADNVLHLAYPLRCEERSFVVWCWSLYFGAVVDWGGFGWRMLGLGWRRMLVFVERFLDEVWHAGVEDSCFVVPVQADANVFASLPVDCDLVVFF